MADLQGFNANEVEPLPEWGPLPVGEYTVAVVESQMRPNRSGVGSHLELTFQVLEGEFKGRLLWERLSLQHANEQAVKIARARLASLCRAVSVPTPQDSTELHNLPLVIRTGLRRRDDTHELATVIRDYKPRGRQPTKSPPPPSGGTSAPGGNSSPPPWKR
jgi:hypothetical protein